MEKLVSEYLDFSKFDETIKYTKKAKHAMEISAQNASKFDIIVAVGGDGSVNEIGKQLINTNTTLAIIPAGSGNGLSRNLNIPMNIKKAILLINKGNTKAIDTVKINNQAFSFPIDDFQILFLGDIESQYALFENSYIQYQLNKKLKPFSNEATANKYSISELNRRLKSLLSQKKLNKIELDFKQKDLNRNKSLYSKGVISLQEYENKQLEYAQNQRNYKNFEFSISQIKEAISNARKNSKGTEINKLKEEMILLKNVIQSFNQLKKSVKDWEYRYVLQSNINGKISFLNIWSINQTVNQGDLVFTIIPDDNSSYIAKLKTPAQNSGKMKIGQKVNIKLDNYPNTEFGILNGTVNNISLITDEKGLYAVDVKLSDKLITSYNKEIIFKQEMTGIAEIITEDLRLIERFFYQLKQLFQN